MLLFAGVVWGVHPCQTTQPPNSKQRNRNSQIILLETSHNWNDTQPTKTICLSLNIFSTRMRLIFIHAEGSSPAEGPVVFLLFHGLPPRKGKSQPNKACDINMTFISFRVLPNSREIECQKNDLQVQGQLHQQLPCRPSRPSRAAWTPRPPAPWQRESCEGKKQKKITRACAWRFPGSTWRSALTYFKAVAYSYR